MYLLVPLCFRSSCQMVPPCLTNFGSGALDADFPRLLGAGQRRRRCTRPGRPRGPADGQERLSDQDRLRAHAVAVAGDEYAAAGRGEMPRRLLRPHGRRLLPVRRHQDQALQVKFGDQRVGRCQPRGGRRLQRSRRRLLVVRAIRQHADRLQHPGCAAGRTGRYAWSGKPVHGARRLAAAGPLCHRGGRLRRARLPQRQQQKSPQLGHQRRHGWTIGVNLCDEQEFADGGRVTGIAGGEFGYVMQETSIRRMIFQPGSDTAFRFERVEKEHGAAAGYAVVATINAVFFISNDGFYSFGESGLVPIGAQRVNRWFRANSDSARFFSVIAFTDPYAPRIYWAFYNAAGSANFDRLLIYDWQLDRWSWSDAGAMFWATSVTSGLSLEALDTFGSIDTGVPYSLDSRVWEGGRPVIGALDIAGRLAFLEGAAPRDATLATAPLQLNPGARANVGSVMPIGVFNGASLAVRAGRRERTQDPVSYTAAVTPSARSGIARLKASGRFHEIGQTLQQDSGH